MMEFTETPNVAPAPYHYVSLSALDAVTVRDRLGHYLTINAPVGLYLGRNGLTIKGQPGTGTTFKSGSHNAEIVAAVFEGTVFVDNDSLATAVAIALLRLRLGL